MADQVISTTPVIDPFEKAKQKAKDRILSSTPAVIPQPSMQDKVYGASQHQEYLNFLNSELPKALQKLGIPDQGIPMNEVGKITLMQRMKSKLGEGFMQNPEAIKILSMFGKAFPTEQTDEQKQQLSSAERTLGYLLGGK